MKHVYAARGRPHDASGSSSYRVCFETEVAVFLSQCKWSEEEDHGEQIPSLSPFETLLIKRGMLSEIVDLSQPLQSENFHSTENVFG